MGSVDTFRQWAIDGCKGRTTLLSGWIGSQVELREAILVSVIVVPVHSSVAL